MKKIGVSSCFLYPDVNRNVFGPKTLCYLERDMARYLSSDNYIPVLIPDLDKNNLQSFLEQLDGFVFQGGTDIAPESYNEKPISDGKWKGDKYRDEYELEIMHYAISNNKPVLGICRGFQLMNVYFGGTLYQDIATQKTDAVKHRDAQQYDQLNHLIEISAGTLFDKLFAEEQNPIVNSVHHQGVKTLGKNLDIFAVCKEDKLIEAFGWKGAENGKVTGVQWHPEFSPNSNKKLINEKHIIQYFTQFL
jgi:putative glutamine amidotransferase